MSQKFSTYSKISAYSIDKDHGLPWCDECGIPLLPSICCHRQDHGCDTATTLYCPCCGQFYRGISPANMRAAERLESFYDGPDVDTGEALDRWDRERALTADVPGQLLLIEDILNDNSQPVEEASKPIIEATVPDPFDVDEALLHFACQQLFHEDDSAGVGSCDLHNYRSKRYQATIDYLVRKGLLAPKGTRKIHDHEYLDSCAYGHSAIPKVDVQVYAPTQQGLFQNAVAEGVYES